MSPSMDIQEGMQVYGGDQLLGRVERVHGDGFHVNGLHYTREMVTHIEHNRIFLGDSGAGGDAAAIGTTGESGAGVAASTVADLHDTGTVGAGGTARTDELDAGALRVPVAEERLAVGTREVDRGEVAIRKTVVEEEQTVPITLTHEEVRFEERAVEERPATGDRLFQEETIRVPLRGEEAVVAKEAVATGEVVVEKDAVAEQRQITDTVRRQHVDVDQTDRPVAASDTGLATRAMLANADPTIMRAAGETTDTGKHVREAMAVVGADEKHIGRVKEVRARDFLIDRRFARDVYVPFSAIKDVTDDTVTLTVEAGDVNDQGWPNP